MAEACNLESEGDMTRGEVLITVLIMSWASAIVAIMANPYTFGVRPDALLPIVLIMWLVMIGLCLIGESLSKKGPP